MTLIKMKKRFVMPLPQLARLVLRFVYDKKHVSADDTEMMYQSIVHWSNKIVLEEDELHKLQIIAKILKLDEDGGLEERKELFKKHGINWAKFHRVPDMKELGDVIS